MAINSDDKILIGYNSGSELDGSPVSGGYCPWIFFGEWALGITGVSSVQRLLAWEFRENYVFSDSIDLINFISKILLDNEVGFKADGDNVRTFGISGILVHRSGKIWDVSNCLVLTEMPIGEVWARGSGSEYALGAFDALNRIDHVYSVQEKINIALEVAISNDIYSVGPAVVSVLWSINDAEMNPANPRLQ